MPLLDMKRIKIQTFWGQISAKSPLVAEQKVLHNLVKLVLILHVDVMLSIREPMQPETVDGCSPIF